MAPTTGTSPSLAIPKKPRKSGGMFRKLKPQKLAPRLTPRRCIQRRRRRSSTTFQREPPEILQAEQDIKKSAAVVASPPRSDSSSPLSLSETATSCTSPRPAMMEAPSFNIFDNDGVSLTPPASCPAPLIVSAKRHGNEVRRSHSSKRRRGGGRFSAARGDGKENQRNSSDCPMSEWRDFSSFGETASTSDDDSSDGLPASFKDLSPAEQSKHFWNLCGLDPEQQQQSWSASRKPPAKSCLSSTRRAMTAPPATRQATPRPPPIPPQSIRFHTPTGSPEEEESGTIHRSTNGKSIQFRVSSAVEFETELPANVLTPIPSDEVQERFPLEKEETEEEVEQSEETKRNSAILADWDDYEEEDSDDEDADELGEIESSSSSRRNRRRRSSAFFSPSEGSTGLLVPEDDELVEHEPDGDVSELNNMALLAVRSPVSKNLNRVEVEKPEATDGDSMDSENIVDKEILKTEFPVYKNSYSEMESVETPKEVAPSQISEDATPPSDVQLGNVNRSGGALLSETDKQFPREMPDNVRQLHGALEECVDDEIDILGTLLKNPDMEVEWDSFKVLANMARQVPLSIGPFPKPKANVLAKIGSVAAGLGVPMLNSIREPVLKETEKLVVADPSDTELVHVHHTELRVIAHKVVCHDWQKIEIQLLKTLVEEMEKLDFTCSLEESKLDRFLSKKQPKNRFRSQARLQQRIVEEEQAIAELEAAVTIENKNLDYLQSRAALADVKRDVEEAVPLPVLTCLGLNGLSPFQLCTITDEIVEIRFPGAVDGYETHLVVSLVHAIEHDDVVVPAIDGFVTSTNTAAGDNSRPLGPGDDMAAWFHQSLLCGGGILDGDGLLSNPCRVPLSSTIVHRIKSSDLQQIVHDASNILGRMDLAAIDLKNVMASFDRSNGTIEFDDDEDTVTLTVSIQDIDIKFSYDRQDDQCILFSIPTRVQVLYSEGCILEHLQDIATEAWTKLSSVVASASSLETTCSAVSKATRGNCNNSN